MYNDILVASNGVAASAEVLFPELPSPGDTVTINGTVFTSGIDADFYGRLTEVQSGPAVFTDRDQAALVANLANKIRATNGLGFTAYPEGPVLWIVALAAGTAANAWTLSTSNSTAITVPATFSGGVDGPGGGGGIPQGGPLTQDLDGGGFNLVDFNSITAFEVQFTGGSALTGINGTSEISVATDGVGDRLTFGGSVIANSLFGPLASSPNGTSNTFLLDNGDVSFCTVSGSELGATLLDGSTGNLIINSLRVSSDIAFGNGAITEVFGLSTIVPCTDGSTSGLAAFESDGSLTQASDDSTTPTNTLTPAGWFNIGGGKYLPYYG
jgi:hypothetical protein